MSPQQYKYKAFISYSHQDAKWGDWLHKALESYTVPKAIRGKTNRDGKVPDKLFPVFRDREELPTATDLGAVISNAIQESAYLIVICSPRSAKSMWVNQEIINFKALGRENRVLAIIVDGEPNGLDKPGMEDIECFPEALRYVVGDDGKLSSERTEPIAADARVGKDGKKNALIKLISGLLGVNYDDLKQREKTRLRNRRISYSVAAVFFCVVGIGYWQYAQNLERQRLVAESLTIAADSQVALKQGDSKSAIKLALQALPANLDTPDRPYVEQAETALSQAMYQHHERFSIQAHQGKALVSTMTPDGKYMITTGEDRIIKQWDNASQNLVKQLLGHKVPLLNMAYHPDRPILLSWDQENRVILWDMQSGQSTAEFYQYGSQYTKEIYWDATGRYAFVNQTVWDLNNNKKVELLFSDAIKNAENTGLIIPFGSGSRIVVADKGHLIFIDLATSQQLAVIQIPESIEVYPGELRRVELINNGQQILTIHEYGKSFLFDAKTFKLLRKLEIKLENLLSTSREDGQLLYFDDYNFRLWDPNTNISRKLNEGISELYINDGISLLKSNQDIAVIQKPNSIDFIDLVSAKIIATLASGKKQDGSGNSYDRIRTIQHIDINVKSHQLNMALVDGRIKAFDLSTIKDRLSFNLGGEIKKLRSSKNAVYYAAYLDNQQLVLVDIEQQQIIPLMDNISPVDFIFANQDRFLVVLANDELKLIDLNQPDKIESIHPFKAKLKLKRQLSLSRSGEKIAVYGDSGEQRVYDLSTKKWLTQSTGSGLEAVTNLADKWLVKNNQVHFSLLDTEFLRQAETLIENKTLDSLYKSQFKFNLNMTRAIWLDKNGRIEYWDLQSNKAIASIQMNYSSSRFFDMTESGDSALIGNDQELLIFDENANVKPNVDDTSSISANTNVENVNKKITPQLAGDASFVNAWFDREKNKVTVIEKLEKQGESIQVIYNYDVMNNKILWQSTPIAEDLFVFNSNFDSIMMKSKRQVVIYHRNTRQMSSASTQLAKLTDSIVQVDSQNEQFLTYRNKSLSLWKLEQNKPEWTSETYSQGTLFFSRDGKTFANVINFNSGGGNIDIYSSKTGKLLASDQGHDGIVYGFDKNDHIISWQKGYAICRWDWRIKTTLDRGQDLTDKSQCKTKLFNNGQVYSIRNHLIVVNDIDIYHLMDSQNSLIAEGLLDSDSASDGNNVIDKQAFSSLASFSCQSSLTLFPVFSDSESVSCINQKQKIQIFNLKQMKARWPFSNEVNISNFVQSLNGRHLAGLDDKGGIHIVDLQNPTAAHKLMKSKNIARFQIDDSGKYVSVLKTNWKLELWDIQSLQLIKSIQLNENEMAFLGQMSLFLTENRESLLVFSYGDIYIWDPGSKKSNSKNRELTNFKIGNVDRHTPIKFSLQKKRLIQIDYSGIHLWDWKSGEKIANHESGGFISGSNRISINHSFNQFSVMTDQFDVFDLLSGKKLLSISDVNSESLVFSPSQQYVALKKLTIADSVTVEVWDLKSLKKMSELIVFSKQAILVFSKDSKSLFSMGEKGLIKHWFLHTDKGSLDAVSNIKLTDNSVNLDRDWLINKSSSWQGKSVAMASPQTSEDVSLVNVYSDDNVTYGLAKEKVLFEVTSDGRYLLTRRNLFSLDVFSLNTLMPQAKIEGAVGEIAHYELSTVNQTVTTLSQNGSLQIWDLNSGKEIFRLDDTENSQKSHLNSGLSLSPEGGILSFFDGHVSIWNNHRSDKLGSFDLSGEILAVQLNNNANQAAVFDKSGVIDFIPLQPKGQVLIDKARELVGNNQ